ncbi:MAG: 3D-(3,5/4)-trihydroxycyclohexane-1,2-dione acylhydrolase (decyclizing) [Candidatus Marinimicrobia bacterium]|nr:3D-(3,5/4)-trihydroxycyclohexane-1,2-dione acylhydrolase (decyclizing) [Candidatus Neomarinimicrobiota bacterium]
MGNSIRLTTAQAIVRFLKAQWVEFDDLSHPFFAGMFGIFGHGNVAGIGQALEQDGEFTHYLPRNEQGMVHIAAAFAKQHRRLKALVCTSSVGPGATNMVTGAAGATINRVPVLLLPGDIFANRSVAPVLQQLEHPQSQDISVNDTFKPVSRYWDRINRPEQILTAFPAAMRVLTSPADTGAVTIALPQDVQAEAFDFPQQFFEKRIYLIARREPDEAALTRAVELIMQSNRPLVVAGGGVLYSRAEDALAQFCAATGIPIGETQAGKGSLPWNHRQNLGAVGATGTLAANQTALEADLVICLGTRLSDFTTASKTQFQHPDVKFININVNDADAYKHSALAVVADAKVTLASMRERLVERGYHVSKSYAESCGSLKSQWDQEVARIYAPQEDQQLTQGEVIGLVNDFMLENDTVVAAAGSLPGDMHKLWRVENGDQYHMEYGYSCMGYEIAGGLGAILAKDEGEVIVMMGDGSYLMMHTELVTSIQEHKKLIVVLLDNHGFGSINGLSKSLGSLGFGNQYRMRDPRTKKYTGDFIKIDFAQNAASLGAVGIKANTREEIMAALEQARSNEQLTLIHIDIGPSDVPGYDTWWEVPVAEVSGMPSVKKARAEYDKNIQKKRQFNS